MTYNVLMGTLNPTHSFIHASLCTVLLTFLLSLLNAFMYLQSAAVPALSPLYYLVSRFFHGAYRGAELLLLPNTTGRCRLVTCYNMICQSACLGSCLAIDAFLIEFIVSGNSVVKTVFACR